MVCTVVGSYPAKFLDLYIKPHYFNDRPLAIANRLIVIISGDGLGRSRPLGLRPHSSTSNHPTLPHLPETGSPSKLPPSPPPPLSLPPLPLGLTDNVAQVRH